MSSVAKEDVDSKSHIHRPEDFELQPGESGFILARAKLSYAPPQPNIWVRRNGYAFDYFIETPQTSDQKIARDAETVAGFLAAELEQGIHYSPRSLEDSGKLKLPRKALRAALVALEASGRVEERQLPKNKRRGQRKGFLFPTGNPAYCAGDGGAIDVKTDATEGGDPAIAPTIAIAPPYRETINGAIDAVHCSPDSLIAPGNDGAIAAQWRNSEDGQPASPVDNKESLQPPPQPPTPDDSGWFVP